MSNLSVSIWSLTITECSLLVEVFPGDWSQDQVVDNLVLSQREFEA